MAYQPETNTYPAGIYQLEVGDPVLGGLGGVANLPLLQLADRTNYLNALVVALTAAVAGLAPINSPGFTGTPTAPTAAPSNSSLSLATTAYVTRAIDGQTLISTTGGVTTLTADQAAVPMLVVSGSLTSNATVKLPTSQPRLFRVSNQTIGAFLLSITTTTGTGVHVGQGLDVLVYVDGTNAVAGVDGVVGALDVAGAVALHSGLTLDNGTYLSAGLTSGVTQVLGITGSNNLIVGSTAAGGGHNGTFFQNNGVTLAQITQTGNLGVGANPGGYRILAYVDGANSEIRAVSNSVGDGILSAAPTGANVASLAGRRASGYLALAINGNDKLTLSTAATMALGAVSHVAQLNVAGNAYLLNNTGAMVRLADQYAEAQIRGVADPGVSSTHMDLWTAVGAGGTAPVMRLWNTGNVTIGGITANAYKFRVSSTSGPAAAFISAAGSPQITVGDGNVSAYAGYTSGSGATAVCYVGTSTAHALCLMTGGSEQLRVTTAGNVGIGTPTPTVIAGYRSLTLNGSGGSFVDLQVSGVVSGRVAGTSASMNLDTVAANNPMIFLVGGTEVARFGGTYRHMGLGTGDTSAYLTIGNGTPQEAIRMLGDGTFLSGYGASGITRNGYLQFINTQVNLASDTGNINFLTGGGVNRMMIMEAGLVGIGMTPTYLLDVGGTARAQAFIGPLTGNVSGNVSGTAGSAAFAATAPWTGISGRPTTLSAFTNDAGYVTAASSPVTSVAGRGGAVSLTIGDVAGGAPLASAALTGAPTINGSAALAVAAFLGSNQSLGSSGYQKLPGGLILQWGVTGAFSDNNSATVIFPIQFPNNCFVAAGIPQVSTLNDDAFCSVLGTPTTSQFVLNRNISTTGVNPGGMVCWWWAIGN